MPNMNELMTVLQLTDLVAYLQDKYHVVLPAPYPYSIYRYGLAEPDVD